MREKFPDEITAANALATIDLLGWAFDKFHPRLALASSFQAEASVLIDHIHRQRGADTDQDAAEYELTGRAHGSPQFERKAIKIAGDG